MSAKWRRSKRNSRKDSRFSNHSTEPKDKITPQTFSAKKTMIKRLPHPLHCTGFRRFMEKERQENLNP